MNIKKNITAGLKWTTIITIMIIVLCFSLESLFGRVQNSANSLWQKAVITIKKSSKWFPTRIIENETIYDRKGSAIEKTTTIIGFNNNTRFKLLSATKNGINLNGRDLKALLSHLKNISKKDIFPMELNPFHLKQQKYFTVIDTNESKFICGKRCRGFSYIQKTDDNIWKGIAWLNEKTGNPLLLSCRPKKTISNYNEIKVTSLHMKVYYNYTKNFIWTVKKAVITANFTYRPMPLISYKGRSLTTIKFDEYIKLSN